MQNVTYEDVSTKGSEVNRFLVKLDGAVIGMLEKWKRERGFIHPWKVFYGTGHGAEYLGAWYKADGGKLGAVRHLLAIHRHNIRRRANMRCGMATPAGMTVAEINAAMREIRSESGV